MDKKYNPLEKEKHIRALWEKEHIYTAENNPGPLYSIDTPPPTVSGSLHIGHIFSYTQTDIIARYKRMSGFSVFYPFGFDDNGLPTEKFVEKKHKVFAPNMSRSEFIDLCLKETHVVEKEFKDLWQQIGLSVDWDKWYSTISESTRKISQESFIRLLKKGYIYRKEDPALYCTNCRTSVAQAELDDIEKPSTFNDIVFSLPDGTELIIGTTRPELLPSCVALLYHPQDSRYTHLKNKKAIVPIFNHEVPILEDESVDPEKGTGLVMVCTFGDKTDVHWYKKFRLPYRQSIGLDGKFVPLTGILAGLKVPAARERIIEELKERNLLRNQKPITHAVNVHERCKKEIEYTVLEQWFINILDHKKTLLSLADSISWYPAHMKSRFVNWVENLQWDWCISRQRFYGIPFPVWFCQSCNEILLPEIKDLPIDPQEKAYPGTCSKCNSDAIIPDTDVMDTWNTSSLTPYIAYTLFTEKDSSPFEEQITKEFLPMGMRPQAHDIIRTWAFYTLVKTYMHNDSIPWKDIVISGHVLSDSKEKLSKSKGNNKLTPEVLLKTHSADVIRFWTASGNLGQDITFSENQLKIGRRLVTKLWNAFRFTKDHISSMTNPKKQPHNLGTLNEWLVHNASNCFKTYKKYFDDHEFHHALQTVDSFFWNKFCDNYLELIKHQLFNPDEYTKEEVHATQWTLYHVGLQILQFYAPYLPYITDSLYQIIYRDTIKIASIHATKFDVIQFESRFKESSNEVEKIIEIISLIRKLKSENQLSLNTELASLTFYDFPNSLKTIIEKHKQLLKNATKSLSLSFSDEQKDNSKIIADKDIYKAVIASESLT